MFLWFASLGRWRIGGPGSHGWTETWRVGFLYVASIQLVCSQYGALASAFSRWILVTAVGTMDPLKEVTDSTRRTQSTNPANRGDTWHILCSRTELLHLVTTDWPPYPVHSPMMYVHPSGPTTHFVHLFRVDIPPLSYSKDLLLRICIVGITHSQGPVEDEVQSLAAVLLRRIVRIAPNSQLNTTIKACKHPQSVCPTENVTETP
jgi:hypothetical protein